MDKKISSAWVSPGGLSSKQEIKILICYVLNQLNLPIKKQEITAVLQNYGLANYFESSEAFEELVSVGNIKEDKENIGSFSLETSGRLIADELSGSLPLSVREKAVKNTKIYLERSKKEQENKVSIQKSKNGYEVTCEISGGDFRMLSLTLYTPDLESVSSVKNNFYKDPAALYDSVLRVLTKN